jgi:hypothetical protein
MLILHRAVFLRLRRPPELTKSKFRDVESLGQRVFRGLGLILWISMDSVKAARCLYTADGQWQ